MFEEWNINGNLLFETWRNGFGGIWASRSFQLATIALLICLLLGFAGMYWEEKLEGNTLAYPRIEAQYYGKICNVS